MRTKKNRLCQLWKVDSAYVVADDTSDFQLNVSDQYYNTTLEFTKGGGYSSTQYVLDPDDPSNPDPIVRVDVRGTWEFFNEKTQLYTYMDQTEVWLADNSVIDESYIDGQTWRIVKLQKDELKLWFWWQGNTIQHTELWLTPLVD